nr:hypothetical protein [Dietzia maris]
MVDRNVVLDEAVRAVETVTAEDAVRMLPREGWLPVLLRVDSFLSGARLVGRVVQQQRRQCWWDAPAGHHESSLVAAARRAAASEASQACRSGKESDAAAALGARFAADVVASVLGV